MFNLNEQQNMFRQRIAKHRILCVSLSDTKWTALKNFRAFHKFFLNNNESYRKRGKESSCCVGWFYGDYTTQWTLVVVAAAAAYCISLSHALAEHFVAFWYWRFFRKTSECGCKWNLFVIKFVDKCVARLCMLYMCVKSECMLRFWWKFLEKCNFGFGWIF